MFKRLMWSVFGEVLVILLWAAVVGILEGWFIFKGWGTHSYPGAFEWLFLGAGVLVTVAGMLVITHIYDSHWRKQPRKF